MARISIWGVFVGGIVDVGLSIILGIAVILLALGPNLAELNGASAMAAVNSAMASDPQLYWISFGVGSLCSVIGGFVAASIAGRGDIVNGALSAWLCVAQGLVPVFMGTSDALAQPTKEAGIILLSIALGSLGGLVRGWLRAG